MPLGWGTAPPGARRSRGMVCEFARDGGNVPAVRLDVSMGPQIDMSSLSYAVRSSICESEARVKL